MPGLTTTNDGDSPVRVVVTPSQSSYFAGESFSVTITFTNTRSPEAGPSKPSSHSHKRGAHSISSAPLARPPTSPGTPRSAAVQSPSVRSKQIEELPRRKGFIGKSKTSPPSPPSPPSLPQGSEKLPELIEQRRKRQLVPKSLSVSISPYDFEVQLDGVTASSAPYSQKSFYPDPRHTPTTPHIPSPLSRTDTLPLSSNHPHARKQSILDGQFSLDVLSPTTSVPPSPYTPSSSTSTFSLALDPIAEATMSPYPSTPAIGPPTIEPAHDSFPPHTPTPSTSNNLPSTNSVYAYPPPRHMHNRPAPIGLGQPLNSPRGYIQSPRSAFATTFPPSNNELILYSYVQLSGTVLISPTSGALPSADQIYTLNAVRSALLNRSVLGGGSMDITSTIHPSSSLSPVPSPKPRQRQTHSRSSSFSAGSFLSLLSPTSLVSSMTSSPTPPSSAGHSRSGSVRWRSASSTYSATAMTPSSGRFPNSSSSPSVLGFGNVNVAGQDFDPEEPLPTFEIQPAMLAVDLSLAPGESRSYTYTINLPDNLPPTFKGKSLKFNYELVVGTCRAGPSGGGGVSANSISRVMKVPVRIYNHVSVGRYLKPYDLLWPVSRRQDVGMPGTEAKVVEELRDSRKTPSRLPSSPNVLSSTTNTLESIQDYARSLLASLPDPVSDEEDGGTTADVESSPSSNEDSNRFNNNNNNSNSNRHQSGLNGTQNGKRRNVRREELRRTESERERVEEVNLTGCKEAVEILTRNPKKASYDVNKDGVKVAVLTFTKSAYRLGETVTGVVELNERTSRARVLKLSAILESHETLPSTISPTSSARHLRRAHAESHSSFTLNTLRTTFSLDIPSDASPAFQIRVGTQPISHSSPNSNSPGASRTHTQGQAPQGLPTPGGLEWKVRLCLLVGMAPENTYVGVQGARFKSLVRDGPRGEWGSSWRATPDDAPMVKVLPKPKPKAVVVMKDKDKQGFKHQREEEKSQLSLSTYLATPRMWSKFLVSTILYGGASEDTESEYHDGDVLDNDEDQDQDIDANANNVNGHGHGLWDDQGYDGIIPDPAGGVGVGVDYAAGDGEGEGAWKDVKLETVECEVPVKVYPGNTAFKAVDVVFDV